MLRIRNEDIEIEEDFKAIVVKAIKADDDSQVKQWLESGQLNVNQELTYISDIYYDPLDPEVVEDTAPLLHCAADAGSVKVLKVLLDKGAHVDCTNELGDTPLKYAVMGGYDDMCMMLLQHGANADECHHGNSLIDCAAEKGYERICEMLLQHGANVGGSDVITPLHRAAGGGYDNICMMLLRHGAQVNVISLHSGDTPLGLAAQGGHDKICMMLLQHGAKADMTDFATPLCHAAEGGYDKICIMLLQHGARIGRRGRRKNLLKMCKDERTRQAIIDFITQAQANFAANVIADVEEYCDVAGLSFPNDDVVVVEVSKSKKNKPAQIISVRSPPAAFTPRMPMPRSNHAFGPQRNFAKGAPCVNFVKNVLEQSDSVAKIVFGGLTGTGCRVGERFVLTNYHVCKDQDDGMDRDNKYAVFGFNGPHPPWMQDTYIFFAAQPIVAFDEALDFAILDLDPNYRPPRLPPLEEMPRALTNFKAIGPHTEYLHFIGHPAGAAKAVDFGCRLCPSSSDDPAAIKKEIKDIQDWSMKTHGENLYTGIDSKKRVLYHSAVDWAGGASGAPGFVSDDQSNAYLAVLHTFAYPSSDVGAPRDKTIEQGIRIECVYESLLEKDEELCEHIFGGWAPTPPRLCGAVV